MLQKWHRIVKMISKGILNHELHKDGQSDSQGTNQTAASLTRKNRRIVSQNVYFYGGSFEPKYMNNYEYNYFQSTVQSFLHLFISQSITLRHSLPLIFISVLCWVQDALHQCWGVSSLVAFLISLFHLCLSKLFFSSILLLPFPLLASSAHIAPLSTLLLLSTIYLTSAAP